ncbi:hypothetical protein LTR70_010204, partial [Exophiala xenobiotica]
MTSDYNPESSRPPPQLPVGNSSSLRGVTENFSFHSSPEAFITSRVQQWQSENASASNPRTPIRAKILNRNVAVVSSYKQIQAILSASSNDSGESDSQPPYVASQAYDELMTEFFPPPNLLLSDGCPHAGMRNVWDERMESLHALVLGRQSSASSVVASFFNDGSCVPLNSPIDLYETMKKLAWRILLDAFLGLSPDRDDKLFAEVQSLHEELLRGQFSLMPISVNTKIFRSPRSKGIHARKKLQGVITQRLQALQEDRAADRTVGGADGSGRRRPFLDVQGQQQMDEVRDHVLMMTSSLAAKGLASLLTAFFVNLFLFEMGGVKIADDLKALVEHGQIDQRRKVLRSIYLETERLSPPIVGVMRRVTRDMVVDGGDGEAGTLLPKGWDIWMYFVGGGRDPAVFGENCSSFDPLRYMNDDVPEPLGFGAGAKSCIGKNFVRDIVLLTGEHCLTSGWSMEGDISKAGLKAWLGWADAAPEKWEADMKQLPTQHPTAPVM